MSYQQTLVHILEASVPQLLAQSPEEMQHKTDPSRWSKQEIMGHLVDSAYNNHQRFIRAEAQGNLIFNGYDQVDWVKRNAYQDREWTAIVKLWEASNRHLGHVTASIDPGFLENKTSDHNFHIIGMNRPEGGSLSSLSYLIWDYIFHLEHHLVQLLPNYERILPPFEGTT
ncbi:MAG: DinB family protein [Saprospiraceae bacterium]|nr:DinB family protein [Saprospiraceae bacterium]